MAEFNEQEHMDNDIMELDAVTMEQYKQTFTQSTFQEELTGYFPLLHRIMSETNKVDLDDYVGEETTVEETEEDTEVKESAFDQFESWAEAVEQGKLADDEIAALKQALVDLPEGQLDLDTAYNFFSEFGVDDSDLEDKFRQAQALDSTTDPIEVFKLWANENYPELLVALGMSDTEAPVEPAPVDPAAPPAPEQPVVEGPGRMINGKEIDMRSLEIDGVDPRDYPDFSDAYISHASFTDGTDLSDEEMDQLNNEHGDLVYDLAYDSLHENTDMVPPPGAMEEGEKEGKGSMVQEVAKIVKSFYNRDNPAVGPFRGEEGIVIDVEKQISEKFGEDAGQQAGKMAEAFMEKLTQQWQQKHGDVANGHGDDGLARLKELLGHVKSKVEGIGPDKEDPPFDPDPPRDGERKDQFGNPIKHVAKHLAKQGMKQVQGDDSLARLKELLDNVKAKVEGIGDQGQGGRDFNKNIMPAEEEASHQTQTTMKHADNPTYQQRAAAQDIKPGIAGYRDRIDMLKDLERTGKLKGQEEAYNPNSVDAEHRRGLEASHEKHLKDKAASGDKNAQSRLDALAQKKERMRNDYDARMEREGVDKSQVPAYKRKEQGGDWKMSTKDLEKEKTNSPTSSAGLARQKAELGIREELASIMRLANHKK
jgi:hypothetical protein